MEILGLNFVDPVDGQRNLNEGSKVLRRSKRANRELVMDSTNVKAVIASVHLDQVLYDLVIRKAPYTRNPMVVGYLEDFFAFTMSQRLEMMFVPIDNTKLPEQLGKVIVTTMFQQTLVDRCRTIMTTYPCEYMTEADKNNCKATRYTPCYSKDNPPVGYGFGQWEMLNSFEELLSYRRSYTPGGTEPSLIIEEQPTVLNREKRSPMRGRGYKKRSGSRSSSSSGRSRGSGGSMKRPGSPSRNLLMRLGAGSGVGAGLGATKVRPGAGNPGVFSTLSLRDIRRMNAQGRTGLGSVSGTHSFTSGSGLHAANPPPVSLTNLRARTGSLDSIPTRTQMGGSPASSLAGSSRTLTRGEVAVPQPVSPPRSGWQPLPQVEPPRSGWHPMPPLETPQYFIPRYKQRPASQQRQNLAGDRPLTRSHSTSSLESIDPSSGGSRSPSRITNEGGSFLPTVREDFKLHNRLGDSMRTFADRHPYVVKAGAYAGTGIAGLGAYIAASQIDRAIQKKQDAAEDNTKEKHKNETATLEANLLREKLANEKFKIQSEFASKVLTDAIQTGQVPTALVANATQRPPVLPAQPAPSYGLWPAYNNGKNFLLQFHLRKTSFWIIVSNFP